MKRFLLRMAFLSATGIAVLILIVIAAAFASGAFYFWLISKQVEPPAAALLVSAAAIGGAGLIALAAFGIGRRGEAYAAPRRLSVAPLIELASEMGELLGREAVSLAEKHPYRAVLVSLAAGFAVGARPELQRIRKTAARR
jgi:hypothetical protein